MSIKLPDPTADFPPPQQDVNPWLGLYFGLGIASAIIMILREPLRPSCVTVLTRRLQRRASGTR